MFVYGADIGTSVYQILTMITQNIKVKNKTKRDRKTYLSSFIHIFNTYANKADGISVQS